MNFDIPSWSSKMFNVWSILYIFFIHGQISIVIQRQKSYNFSISETNMQWPEFFHDLKLILLLKKRSQLYKIYGFIW